MCVIVEIGMPLPLTRMLLDKYRKKAGYTKIPFTSKVKIFSISVRFFLSEGRNCIINSVVFLEDHQSS